MLKFCKNRANRRFGYGVENERRFLFEVHKKRIAKMHEGDGVGECGTMRQMLSEIYFLAH